MGDKGVVEQGREHAARYRTDYVDSDGVEMSGGERRSRGSRGIYRTAGHWAGYQHAAGQGEADRQGGYARRDPVVGGDRDHHEDQDKGDQELHRERPEAPTSSGERGCQEGYLSHPGPVGDPGANGS